MKFKLFFREKKYWVIIMIFVTILFFVIKTNNIFNPKPHYDNTFSSVTQDVSYMEEKNCGEIHNIYIKFVCLRRTTGRPHINLFITKNTTSLNFNISSISQSCSIFDQYPAFYCIYTEAAELSMTNMGDALNECNKIPDTQKRNECMFYIEISQISEISKNTEEKIEFLMNYCDSFIDQDWKSECYFLIADELTFLDSESYLKNIAIACNKSYTARDYYCFHHQVFHMPLEISIEFCDLIDQKHKERCYMAFGHTLGDRSMNKNINVTRECNKLNKEFRYNCYKGLGNGFASYYVENPILGIDNCNQLNKEHSSICMEGLSIQTGLMTQGNFSEGIVWCSSLPEEKYIKRCYRGFGIATYLSREGDTTNSDKIYSKIPETYIQDFLEGFNEKIVLRKT